MGTYIRLVDINDAKGKESAFLSAVQDKNNSIRFETSAENFSKIPGSPVAYWVSEAAYNVFGNSKSIEDFAHPRQGLATGNNDKYLRLWNEVNYYEIKRDAINLYDFFASKCKYIPYNKGGTYRKWFSSLEWVIRFDEVNYNSLKNVGNHLPSRDLYFKESITWSKVTSGGLSMRYVPEGSAFDVAGCSIFIEHNIKYLLSFVNSKVMQYLINCLSQTLNYEVGNIKSIPLIFEKKHINHVEVVSQKNIEISYKDYSSYETSWDFKTHPFVTHKSNDQIEASFKNWEEFAERQFYQLKANEEELNRIFIDIYCLQDELTPDVEEKYVTVRRADLGQDIRSFISYAVGCMLGRYSLDIEGLAYAGGDWDLRKYKTYIPDADNCIPITDEEYFDDDVVSRFVDFVKAVYGKDTLEKNLEFIAEALGNRGDTPLKTIRNYFINEFYKDHLKTYQKRPIYWLFDSGKENGFKALIYMHRYNADTIGNMRIEYIHKLQAKYESQLSFEQHLIDTSQNQREKSAAIKQKEKLIRQIKEIKDYDVKIAHLANCRIEIDLDDGVKVNYEKVQTGKDGKKLEVLGKI